MILIQWPYVISGIVCFSVTYKYFAIVLVVTKLLALLFLKYTLSQLKPVNMQHSVKTMSFSNGVENNVDPGQMLYQKPSDLVGSAVFAEKNKSCIAGKWLTAEQKSFVFSQFKNFMYCLI